MELEKRFGTHRGFLLELERVAGRQKVQLYASDAAIAAELGFVERDPLGRWTKLVDRGEVTNCYVEKWRGDLQGHTVALLRDDGDQYFIATDAPGLAERWNLGLVDPRDSLTGIGLVPKSAVANVRCERAAIEL